MSAEIYRLWPSQWPLYKEIRLRALADSPESFGSTFEREVNFDDEEWKTRMVDQAVFVAESKYNKVGLITAFKKDRTKNEAHVYSVWVDPHFRGQGIVGNLHDAVVIWARENGVTTLMSGYVEGNIPARSAYEKYGFAETGIKTPLRRDPNIFEVEIVLDIG